MNIRPFGNERSRGRSPREITGDTHEMMALVDIYGMQSPTAWRIAGSALLAWYRGKENVTMLLSPSEFTRLARKAVGVVGVDIAEESKFFAISPDASHLALIEAEGSALPAKRNAANAILDYCARNPIPHEVL